MERAIDCAGAFAHKESAAIEISDERTISSSFGDGRPKKRSRASTLIAALPAKRSLSEATAMAWNARVRHSEQALRQKRFDASDDKIPRARRWISVRLADAAR
jgi:hypothetical protein